MKILLSTASVVALLAATPVFAATTPTNMHQRQML
jgi:hypothetical protein